MLMSKKLFGFSLLKSLIIIKLRRRNYYDLCIKCRVDLRLKKLKTQLLVERLLEKCHVVTKFSCSLLKILLLICIWASSMDYICIRIIQQLRFCSEMKYGTLLRLCKSPIPIHAICQSFILTRYKSKLLFLPWHRNEIAI